MNTPEEKNRFFEELWEKAVKQFYESKEKDFQDVPEKDRLIELAKKAGVPHDNLFFEKIVLNLLEDKKNFYNDFKDWICSSGKGLEHLNIMWGRPLTQPLGRDMPPDESIHSESYWQK